MRKNLSRRDFLSKVAFGAGSLTVGQILASCSPLQSIIDPTATSEPILDSETIPTSAPQEQVIQNEAVDHEAEFPPPAVEETAPMPSVETAAGHPDLVVARGGDPAVMVQQSLAALGGIEQFVHPGNSVVIKPNICVAYHSYEYAATTNPWVVGEITRLCIAAGASKVMVMDFPFGGTPQNAYSRSGIGDQVHSAGGEMVVMSDFKFVSVDLPQAVDLKSVEIYDDILNADILIDVPVAKHHSLARLTLGMKNLMGVIQNRPAMHSNIGQRLADLANHIRPQLTIIDAVRMLMANGPTGGNINDVKKADTIIASPDIVAADSYAATLFGLQPNDLAYVQAGSVMGIGRSDLENLKIEEFTSGV